MTIEEIFSLIMMKCKFRYYSYDHKKAIEEYRTSDEFSNINKYIRNPNCWEMPEELKEKYKVERIGKIRKIEFAPSGNPIKFHIGNKRAKVFRIEDFGVNVFPFITTKE